MFAAVCKLGLEGIVSKRSTLPVENLDQGQKSKIGSRDARQGRNLLELRQQNFIQLDITDIPGGTTITKASF
jgi:hypothetical protein